jgi:hypothetical protein
MHPYIHMALWKGTQANLIYNLIKIKIKVKVVPVIFLNSAPRHESVLGEWTSALDGGLFHAVG